MIVPCLEDFRNSKDQGKETFLCAQKISALQIPANSKIASDTNWVKSVFLSYFSNLSYCGQFDSFYKSEEEMLNVLAENHIQYFIQFDSKNSFDFLDEAIELTNDPVSGLKIYKLHY